MYLEKSRTPVWKVRSNIQKYLKIKNNNNNNNNNLVHLS